VTWPALKVFPSLGEQRLDDDAVSPGAVELAVTAIHPDLAQATRTAEGATRLVFRKDATNELEKAQVRARVLTERGRSAGVRAEVARRAGDWSSAAASEELLIEASMASRFFGQYALSLTDGPA
jgi:hypothetical protein